MMTPERQEVAQVTSWITGYTPEELARLELAKGKAMEQISRKQRSDDE